MIMISGLLTLTLLSFGQVSNQDVWDCNGGTVAVTQVIERPELKVIKNCRFNIFEGGGIGFEGVSGVTVQDSSFIAVGNNVEFGLWFNDSSEITVQRSLFKGFKRSGLGFTGGRNFLVQNNAFDAPSSSTGETLVVSPGHAFNIFRVWKERGNKGPLNPNNRWQRGTGLGGTLGPLKARPVAESDGGREATITVVPWSRNLQPGEIYYDDDTYNGSWRNYRVEAYWPGMTGRERFRIESREGNVFKLRVFFGSFPTGKFAVYIHNTENYVENVVVDSNNFVGGGLSGFSAYFTRNLIVTNNSGYLSGDYLLGGEFIENAEFVNNRALFAQGNWNGYELVGWGKNVNFEYNIGTAAIVPHGKPQENIFGEFTIGSSEQLSDALGLKFPVIQEWVPRR